MPHAPKLAEWLEIATAELTTPAKKRIRLEIEEHFAAAVESHTANGCPETDAQSTALAELGDAIAAAKHFRSLRLTEKEAQYIERMLKYSGGWIRMLLYYAMSLLLCLCFFHLLKRHNAPVAFPATAGAIVFFVIPTISFFVSRRSNPKPDIRLLLLLQILYTLSYMVLCIWWAVRINLAMVGMLVGAWPIFRDLPLWHKLGKIGGVWQDMPPNETIVS
jgi:uncharacterized membrane protein